MLHRLLQTAHAVAVLKHNEHRFLSALGAVPGIESQETVDGVKGRHLQLQVLEAQRSQDSCEKDLLAFVVDVAKHFCVTTGHCIDDHK